MEREEVQRVDSADDASRAIASDTNERLSFNAASEEGTT